MKVDAEVQYSNQPKEYIFANDYWKNDMKKPKLNTIDKILIFCTVLLLIFTITMIIIFCIYQSVPDTLIGAFFGAFGIETINTVMIYKDKKRRSHETDN